MDSAARGPGFKALLFLNSAATPKNSLAGLENVKHKSYRLMRHSHPKALPKRDEDTYSHQHLYRDIHGSNLCDTKNGETIQIHIDG